MPVRVGVRVGATQGEGGGFSTYGGGLTSGQGYRGQTSSSTVHVQTQLPNSGYQASPTIRPGAGARPVSNTSGVGANYGPKAGRILDRGGSRTIGRQGTPGSRGGRGFQRQVGGQRVGGRSSNSSSRSRNSQLEQRNREFWDRHRQRMERNQPRGNPRNSSPTAPRNSSRPTPQESPTSPRYQTPRTPGNPSRPGNLPPLGADNPNRPPVNNRDTPPSGTGNPSPNPQRSPLAPAPLPPSQWWYGQRGRRYKVIEKISGYGMAWEWHFATVWGPVQAFHEENDNHPSVAPWERSWATHIAYVVNHGTPPWEEERIVQNRFFEGRYTKGYTRSMRIEDFDTAANVPPTRPVIPLTFRPSTPLPVVPPSLIPFLPPPPITSPPNVPPPGQTPVIPIAPPAIAPIPIPSPTPQDIPTAPPLPNHPAWSDPLPLWNPPIPSLTTPPNGTNWDIDISFGIRIRTPREDPMACRYIPDPRIGQIQTSIAEINRKLGPEIPAIGISGAVTATFMNTLFIKAASAINIAVTIHNAAMLSSAAVQSIIWTVDNLLNAFGFTFKDLQGQQISLSQALGTQIEGGLNSVFGTANVDQVQSLFARANRIVSTAANLLYAVQSIQYSVISVLEIVGDRVSKIGNALRLAGAVNERAYQIMDDQASQTGRFAKFNRFLENANNITAALDQITYLVAEVRGLQAQVDELKNQKNQLTTEINGAQTQVTELLDANKAEDRALPKSNQSALINQEPEIDRRNPAELADWQQ